MWFDWALRDSDRQLPQKKRAWYAQAAILALARPGPQIQAADPILWPYGSAPCMLSITTSRWDQAADRHLWDLGPGTQRSGELTDTTETNENNRLGGSCRTMETPRYVGPIRRFPRDLLESRAHVDCHRSFGAPPWSADNQDVAVPVCLSDQDSQATEQASVPCRSASAYLYLYALYLLDIIIAYSSQAVNSLQPYSPRYVYSA